MNQTKQSKPSPKETEKKPVKVEPKKKNNIQNMFSKVKPKEQTEKPNPNCVNKDEDDDEEILFRNTKKRNRIIDDDDDEEMEKENAPKHIKSDILDSESETEKENSKF